MTADDECLHSRKLQVIEAIREQPQLRSENL